MRTIPTSNTPLYRYHTWSVYRDYYAIFNYDLETIYDFFLLLSTKYSLGYYKPSKLFYTYVS